MCNNFIKFFRSRPPLILFLLCLIFFMIVLSILDNYVKNNDISNIDTRQDWNKVLESFSHLEFCLSTNKTHRNHNLENQKPDKNANQHYIKAILKMYPSNNIINEKSRLVNTFVTGKQLGMKGLYAEDKVNVSFVLPPIHPEQLQCYKNKKCEHIDVSVCLVLTTFSNMFPTKIQPPKCGKEVNFISKSKFSLYLTWHRKETLFRYLSCSGQTSFWTEYQLNTGLTVMLTKEEVAVIHRHVSICIYTLLALICVILIYGVTCGYRNTSDNIIDFHVHKNADR